MFSRERRKNRKAKRKLLKAESKLERAEHTYKLWGTHFGYMPSEQKAMKDDVTYWREEVERLRKGE